MELVASLQIVLANAQYNIEVLKMFVKTSLAHLLIHFNLSTVLCYVMCSFPYAKYLCRDCKEINRA